MKTLVVARYNEDIGWLEKIKGWSFTVYNKGPDIDVTRTSLSNIGREANTYLTHIVNNYDNLSDYTAFVQGDPFPHAPNIIEELNEFLYCSESSEFLWFKKGGHEDLDDKNYFICDSFARPHAYYDLKLFGKTNNIIVPDLICFSPGAQFIVKKETILRRSKEFYSNLLRNIGNNEAYIMERLWKYVFLPI